MRKRREYDDIPGTYVFDPQRSRLGYHLNMFCMSLNDAGNRERFREDPTQYLDQFALTTAQRDAVLNREWLELLRLGGNIYYTFKLAALDHLSMQDIGAKMSGVSSAQFKEMMASGGRPIDGNRSSNVAERE
jgi:protocatechuate 4,5-dioxygenase, alpha chain